MLKDPVVIQLKALSSEHCTMGCGADSQWSIVPRGKKDRVESWNNIIFLRILDKCLH